MAEYSSSGMNLLFLVVFPLSGTFFTDPFQDYLNGSEIVNYSRKLIYQDSDQDINMLGNLLKLYEPLYFEATNVESPTHHEKFDVILKTMLKRNIPYINMERGMKSILLCGFAESYT